MLTSKQRAYLRALANDMDTIFQIGKGGLTDEISERLSDALEARELIKVRVLETSPQSAREAADAVAAATDAEVVQVIGTRFILYRTARDPKKRKLTLSV